MGLVVTLLIGVISSRYPETPSSDDCPKHGLSLVRHTDLKGFRGMGLGVWGPKLLKRCRRFGFRVFGLFRLSSPKRRGAPTLHLFSCEGRLLNLGH